MLVVKDLNVTTVPTKAEALPETESNAVEQEQTPTVEESVKATVSSPTNEDTTPSDIVTPVSLDAVQVPKGEIQAEQTVIKEEIPIVETKSEAVDVSKKDAKESTLTEEVVQP